MFSLGLYKCTQMSLPLSPAPNQHSLLYQPSVTRSAPIVLISSFYPFSLLKSQSFCIPGWPGTHCVADEDDLGVLILQLLPAPALSQDAVITGRSVPLHPIYMALGMEPTAAGKLGSHSASEDTRQAV